MMRRLLPYGVLALPLLPLLAAPFPPVQDLPAHAALIAHLADPAPGSAWETAGWATHSWGFYLAGAALARVLGAWGATLALLGVAAVGFPLAVRALARQAGGDERFALSAVGFAWNVPMVLGFLPFALSAAAALGGLAAVRWAGRRGPPWLAAAVAATCGVAVYELHFLGFAALVALVTLLGPEGRWRRFAAAAGLLPAVALFLASRDGGATLSVDWALPDPTTRIRTVLLALGPGSAAALPDALPAGILVAALLLAIRGRRGAAWWVVAGLVAALGLPDQARAPALVLAVTRFVPLLAGLAVALVPAPAPRAWTATALVLAAASLAWTTGLFVDEGGRLAPQAEAVCRIEAGHTLLGATAHRAAPDSALASYDRIQFPFLYQASGRGETVSPFTHAESPVRYRPEVAAVVRENDTDVRAYLAAGARRCDRLLTDAGDLPAFLDATGVDRLPPCEAEVPAPWLCRRLDGR